jgi:hypothetical protein
LADVLNLVVSIVVANAAAYLLALLVVVVLELVDEPAMVYVYFGMHFLTAVLAGMHLMKRLRWQRRFQVIALGPFALGIAVAFVQIIRADSAISLIERLSLVAEARLAWFTVCGGLAVGAVLIRSWSPRSAVPAA